MRHLHERAGTLPNPGKPPVRVHLHSASLTKQGHGRNGLACSPVQRRSSGGLRGAGALLSRQTNPTGELTLIIPYSAQPANRRPTRYTRGLPPSAAPQPSELARDLAELSQRSASGAEGAGGRAAAPEGTPRGAAPLQLQHWRLLEGGEALPVCRDSVRPRPPRRTGCNGQRWAA